MGLFDTYKASVDLEITTKTDPSSIDPADVGTKFKELCDLIEAPLTDILSFSSGTANPSAGENGDIYLKTGINPIEVYQLIDGDWTLTGTLSLGGLTFYTIDQTSPYYSPSSGGVITIPDFDTDYPVLSANGIVRMQGYAMLGATEVQFDIQPTDIVRSGGNITSLKFYLGYDSAPTSFKARMY